MSQLKYIFSTGEYVETGKSLGVGAFGSIKELTRIRDQKKFALKTQYNVSKQEIEILKNIRDNPNKNVVEIVDFSFGDNLAYIVMEHCDISLYDQIQQKLVDQKDLRYLMVSIADGLRHLHKLNIIHRDLKPENILIKYEKDGRNTQNIYKICDFGLSKQIDVTRTQQIGTCYYMAPELIKGFTYDKKVDIWSFGTIIYELITGSPLFNGCTQNEVMENIIRYESNKKAVDDKLNKLDDEYRQLVFRMLASDPKERISLDEVFNELRVRHRSASVKKTQQVAVLQTGTQNYFRPLSPFQQQTKNFQQQKYSPNDLVNFKMQINNNRQFQNNYMQNFKK